MRTQVPLSAAPVQIGVEPVPIREESSMAAADLATCRSTLFGIIFFSVQCLGEFY